MNARVKVSIIIDVSRFNHFLDNKEILTTLLRMYLIDNGEVDIRTKKFLIFSHRN